MLFKTEFHDQTLTIQALLYISQFICSEALQKCLHFIPRLIFCAAALWHKAMLSRNSRCYCCYALIV